MDEDDQVVMMDEVVNLVNHLVANASHRQVHHHSVLVVNEIAVRQAWEHLEGVVMKVVC